MTSKVIPELGITFERDKEKCKMSEITNKSDLVDICEVSVDKSLPKNERIAEYIRQIKDSSIWRARGS